MYISQRRQLIDTLPKVLSMEHEQNFPSEIHLLSVKQKIWYYTTIYKYKCAKFGRNMYQGFHVVPSLRHQCVTGVVSTDCIINQEPHTDQYEARTACHLTLALCKNWTIFIKDAVHVLRNITFARQPIRDLIRWAELHHTLCYSPRVPRLGTSTAESKGAIVLSEIVLAHYCTFMDVRFLWLI